MIRAAGGSSVNLSLLPGYEFPGGYAEVTSQITAAQVLEASATTIVTAGAITFDGATRIKVEAFFPAIQGGAAGANLNIFLFDGSSSLGFLAFLQPGSNFYAGQALSRFLTPSAAAHTYSIRATSSDGAGKVGGGAGGAGNNLPGYIRVTRA